MKTFKKGGIHPHDNKLTADCRTERLAGGPEYRIMLSQSIGAPSKSLVKVNDHVEAGQMIAEAGGFVGAAIHSPVSGTVKKLEPTRSLQGFWQDSIVIVADDEQPLGADLYDDTPVVLPDAITPQEIIDAVAAAGVVGLGGATFPTRVKLTVPEGKKAELIIINGAECEPMLTCDDRLMRERPRKIIEGARLLMMAVGAKGCIIGIEDNKPEAIAAMRDANPYRESIEIVALKKKYPQGGEKQLIEALTGKRVPAGGLPIDAGVIVDNVATAYAVCQAVCQGIPLTERIVTVTGDSLARPGNYLVRIGTPVSRLIEAAGGMPDEDCKVIAGGPMMGRAISQLDSPTTKGLSGIVVISGKNQYRREQQPCIRCGNCVSRCPMGLEPYLFMLQGEMEMWEEMAEHGAANCIECGCCSYVCPASRAVLDYIRLGKSEIRRLAKR